MSEAVESLGDGQQGRVSPLEAAHLRAGALMRDEGGARVPASYGDARAEYDSVRGGAGAGLFDLSSRGRVEVSGAEAVQFLNGLVTNDVKALAAGAWMAAAFPNPQGRLLAAARIARPTEAQSFLVDTEPATRETVLRNVGRFTLAGDFRVRDLSGETAHLSVQGAAAARVVGGVLGEEAASTGRGRVALAAWPGGRPVTLLRATHTGEDGFDVICDSEGAAGLWDALAEAGARPAGHDALEVLRIEAGLPRYGADADETNVVTEANLDDAVSYTKGCYVGQEIIARIHWRGHVAKKLVGLLLDGEGGDAVTAGAKVRAADGGREIGRVTSVAFSPRLGRTVALGYVKYDFLEPGTEVVVGEAGGLSARALVGSLPLVRGSWYEEEGAAGGGSAEA